MDVRQCTNEVITIAEVAESIKMTETVANEVQHIYGDSKENKAVVRK